jgi:beta-galactosidase
MIAFGVDYYPEHWPEQRWEIDARLMQEAGFNTVRLAEFAWTKLEPREGHFDFVWLDRAIEILYRHNISIVLGTPTASPPAWLVQQAPDILRVRDDGLRVHFGSRRINCPCHPIYRRYSRNITTAMANHFAGHPAVIGWQIDNEFGDRCYCPICRNEFHHWLQKRYHQLEVLNERWGTSFWNQIYSDWCQIPLPFSTLGSPPNPSLALDFRRFVSDAYISFQQEQIDTLRALCPKHFITHDMMGFGYDGINYFDLARSLDFVSWNNYPFGIWHGQAYTPSLPALNHDAMRGIKKENFWVMEEQAGPSGWGTLSVTPRPGDLRLWAYQALAHGADGIIFFRWRTARHGAEQYWHGLLEHDGRAGRRYHEIKQMGAEVKRIGGIIKGSKYKSKVAILNSYDSRFAFQVQGNSDNFHYEKHITQIYVPIWKHNIGIDVISATGDLSQYEILISPSLHILSEETANSLCSFVRAGGTLVVTPRSGVKDESNVVVNQPLPGLLADVCGVFIEEYDAISSEVSQGIVFESTSLAGQRFPVEIWCDLLVPTTAEVLARYEQDYYAGKPAITRNRFGKGQAIYLGTFGTEVFYEALLGWLFQEKGIKNPIETPPNVEMTGRWKDEECFIFLINHTNQEQKLVLDKYFTNLLDGSELMGTVKLAARDVVVLQSPNDQYFLPA